ncbi:MAG: hypothetical protein AB1767_13325 [Bacillota bacterium]
MGEAEPGVQTEVSLWLSSLSDQEEHAVVTVNSLIRGTTSKRHILTQQDTEIVNDLSKVVNVMSSVRARHRFVLPTSVIN